MISKINIENYKGIKNITLSDIGGINVLCGKNNSGKSTILRSLKKINDKNSNNYSTINISITNLTEEILTNYIKYSKKFQEINKNGQFDLITSENTYTKVKDHLINFLNQENKLISSSELNLIAEEFKEYLQDKMPTNWNSTISYEIEKFLSTLFKQIDIHFIDSKRQYSSNESFISITELNIEKNNFLNHLFHLKNKLKGSFENLNYLLIEKEFEVISFGSKFDISLYENNLVLSFSHDSKKWYNADDCGQGLSEILFIIANIVLSNADIYLIEEPENHLHPDIQRRLLSFFSSMVKANKIFFIATHSNIFLDLSIVNKVFHVKFEDQIKVNDDTGKAEILHDIGYSISDNLLADLILLVEGPSDKPVIEELLIKMEIYKEYNIKIWALGGDIMDKHDLSVFAQSHNVFSIIDNDPKSSKVRNKFQANCNSLGIPCLRLERYSIESYFSLRALKEIFKGNMDSSIIELDPNIKLEKQIKLDCKKNNRKIAREMSIDEFIGTDLYKFVLKMKKFLDLKN